MDYFVIVEPSGPPRLVQVPLTINGDRHFQRQSVLIEDALLSGNVGRTELFWRGRRWHALFAADGFEKALEESQACPGYVGRILLYEPGPEGRIDGLSDELAAMHSGFKLPQYLHTSANSNGPTITSYDESGRATHVQCAGDPLRSAAKLYESGEG